MWRLGVRRPGGVAELNHKAAMGIHRRRARIRFAAAPGAKSPAAQRGPRLDFDRPSPAAPITCDPRPWTTREERECAFPVGGVGADTMSCCNAAGRRGYCQAHRRLMLREPAT